VHSAYRAQRAHLLHALQRVDEHDVGAGGGKRGSALQRFVQAGRLAGVGARHDDNVAALVPGGEPG
jgi:hypothetical protein